VEIEEMKSVGIFPGNTADKQAEAIISPKDLLLSMEDDLARMHRILSTGIGANWDGNAYSSHRMLEDTLFQRAEEALDRIRALI